MTFKQLLDINCILLMCLCTACNNNISDGIAVMTGRKQVAEESPVYQIPQQANNTFTLIADDNFSQGGYYYDHISNQAKIIYQALYTGIMQKSETIEVTGQPDDQIKYAYKSLIFDHPEIFWTDGYQIEKYNRADGYKLFRPGYTKSEEECVVIKDELRAYYDKLYLTLDTSSEFKIIQGIYDYLVTHTQYDITAPDLQNITSIVNGRAVCEVYAKGTMYFAKQLGLNCICIPGYIRSSGTAHLFRQPYLLDRP